MVFRCAAQEANFVDRKNTQTTVNQHHQGALRRTGCCYSNSLLRTKTLARTFIKTNSTLIMSSMPTFSCEHWPSRLIADQPLPVIQHFQAVHYRRHCSYANCVLQRLVNPETKSVQQPSVYAFPVRVTNAQARWCSSYQS